jgi:hypothetical protein
VQQARSFARILQYRADLLLARHERDESLRSGLTLLRLSRHFQREPLMVGYLVSIAVQSMAITEIARVLNDGPISAELHDRVAAEAAGCAQSSALVAMLKTERAYGIDSFRDFRGIGPPGNFKRDECDYLRRMAAEIEIGTAPRYQSAEAVAQMNAETQGAGPLTATIVRSLAVAREAHQRLLARLRCLSVLNVLTRQGGERTTPPVIENLNLPDALTTDPYNGQPLRIKRVKAGWIVYSVGPNLNDDGGQLESGNPGSSVDPGVGPNGD